MCERIEGYLDIHTLVHIPSRLLLPVVVFLPITDNHYVYTFFFYFAQHRIKM